MRFLQAHYDEVNALELCYQLTAVTQLSDERAYHFFTRCLEMRKVIAASRQIDDMIPIYSDNYS